MALDARRKQKKAEKRKAKEKAKRKVLAQRKAEGVGAKLARVAAAPILHCFTTQSFWDSGIAQVLVSRELSTGQIAYAAFLVDRYCLGVKDTFCGVKARQEYFERLYDKVVANGEIVVLKAAAARKLVEGAVEYARSIGFSPESGYSDAKHIFGNIDPAESDREFEFGHNGKPLFVSGPYDSPGRCASIVGILNQNCGQGGYESVLQIRGGTLDSSGVLRLSSAFDRYEDDEDEDDEYAEGEYEEDDFDSEDGGVEAEDGGAVEGFVHSKRSPGVD